MIFAGIASAQEMWFYFDFQTLDVTPEILTGLSGYEDPGFQDNPATPEVIGNPEVVPGAIGNAWRFDGASKLDLDNFEAFERVFDKETVIAWFNVDATTSETEGNVFMIYEEGGGTNGMALLIADDQLKAHTRDDCVNRPELEMDCAVPFTDAGTWHQAAIVYDQGTLSLFLDGEEVNSLETGYEDQTVADIPYVAPVSQHTSDAAIGGAQGSCYMGLTDDASYFVGMIDEFIMYKDYAMTALEIQASVEARNKLTSTWGAIKK
jgi:hypothetical protein